MPGTILGARGTRESKTESLCSRDFSQGGGRGGVGNNQVNQGGN